MAGEIVGYTFEIQDSDNYPDHKTLYMQVRFDATPDLADIQATANTLAADLDGTIDGRIEGLLAKIILVVPPTVLAKVIPANIEVEVGATLSFTNENFRRASFFIPTFKKSLMPGKIVDVANAAVSTLINRVLNTGAQGWEVVDANFLDLVGLGSVRGKETTRKG